MIGPLKPCQEPRARGSGRGEGQVGQLKWKSGSLQGSMEQGYRICCSGRWGQSGTVCGFERSWAGWRMPVGLCSSELREGVTNAGLQVRSLAWVASGEISPPLPNSSNELITPLASNHSINTCPGGHPPSRDFSSGTCWPTNGALSLSYSLETVNWAEDNILAYFPSPSQRASHLPDS